jgi:hypothetical protein
MATHRYKFIATFVESEKPIEFETVASSDSTAWRLAVHAAHEYKSEHLKGIGDTLHSLERVR